MYKKLHITYRDPKRKLDPLTVNFNIYETSIAQRWAKLMEESIEKYVIDDPTRFYGFDTLEIERERAVDKINLQIDIINQYQPGFIDRRITEELIQDDLNYLHHIFEVYHGMLNEPHEFYAAAPKTVQNALAQLNILVHRCEDMASSGFRKLSPRHVVTYYGMPRGPEFRVLENDDYQHFTDFVEYGTVYLLYVEIGKTLQDLAMDDDHHISPEAYKPFRHYASDFVVKFFRSSTDTWLGNRQLFKKHYDENKEFYDSRYSYSHIYNKPGNIPLADLQTHLTPDELMEGIRLRQCVSHIELS